jgi:diguanylate cyclase (GGDEF)-like protein
MREQIKIQILQNLLTIVTQKYDYFTSYQNGLIKENFEKATRDPLTGLYNRAYLEEVGINLLDEAKRENLVVALVFIDLNNFKAVNDIYGHEKGDEVLKGVAKELKTAFRSYDIVARFGGDEFIVLLKIKQASFGLENILNLEKILDLENNLKSIDDRIKEKFKKYKTSLSYGIATNLETFGLKNLIEVADARMYEDKRRKKQVRGGEKKLKSGNFKNIISS